MTLPVVSIMDTQCFLANGDEKKNTSLSIDTDTKGQTIEIKWG